MAPRHLWSVWMHKAMNEKEGTNKQMNEVLWPLKIYGHFGHIRQECQVCCITFRMAFMDIKLENYKVNRNSKVAGTCSQSNLAPIMKMTSRQRANDTTDTVNQ